MRNTNQAMHLLTAPNINWQDVIKAIPANGVIYTIPGVGLEAKHTPASRMHCEAIEIRDGNVSWRRINHDGKWSRPQAVNWTGGTCGYLNRR